MTISHTLQVALVEDDEALRAATEQALTLENIKVRSFPDAHAALKALSDRFEGVVVSDIRMPAMDGISFFARLREIDPELPVILTTGHGDIAIAVAAMKDGAADFLTKPYSSAELVQSIRVAADRRALVLENRRLRSELSQRADTSFLGSSQIAQNVRSIVASVAPSEIDVVIEGAVGTGKSSVARMLHELGPRQNRPFVVIDRGILAHEDADLLLFGREPSAGLSRTGLLERANGGTLFLDDLRFHTDQTHSRLVAMLDNRSVLPLGAERARKLNLRIILARSPLDSEDDNALLALEQRLGAVKITLPSLAERRTDIIELFRHFVTLHERELGVQAPGIEPAQWNYIQQHDWPGNLRELSGYARAFVLRVEGAAFGAVAATQGSSLQEIVADFERTVLDDALRQTNGSITAMETVLQAPRKTLYDKLKRYGLRPNDYRRAR